MFEGNTNAGTTSGGAHSHAQSHNHAANPPAHTHSVSSGTGTGSFNAQTTGANSGISTAHSHATSTSAGAGIQAGNTSSDTTPTSSDEVFPPYLRVIAITPNDGNQNLPADVLAFFMAAIPSGSGFLVADGNASTVNAGDRYLRGAVAAGDGGGTGGSATHDHGGSVTHSHTHSHSHGAAASSNNSGGSARTFPSGVAGTLALDPHTHSLTLDSATITFSGDSYEVQSASSEPLNYKLLVAQNKGSAETPIGVIIGYRGDPLDVPSGWMLCDGTAGTPDLDGEIYIKGVTAVGSIGGPNGSNSHSHGSSAHTPSAVSTHNHTVTAAAANVNNGCNSGAQPLSTGTHTHTWTSVASSASYAPSSATVSIGSSNVRASYRTIVWIMHVGLGLVFDSVVSAADSPDPVIAA